MYLTVHSLQVDINTRERDIISQKVEDKWRELKNYYKGWIFHKHNEDFGNLHQRDKDGNFIKMRFVTMLAQKPM